MCLHRYRPSSPRLHLWSAGEYAELVDDAAKTYIAALCPAGTYSDRTSAKKTIKTGCDTIAAGSATNKVGATSATDVSACVAGTYAAKGAAMCLPVSGVAGGDCCAGSSLHFQACACLCTRRHLAAAVSAS